MTRRISDGPTAVFSTRQPEDLQAFADGYAREHGTDRSGLIRAFYEALREGRVEVRPRLGPNPFPGTPEIFPRP